MKKRSKWNEWQKVIPVFFCLVLMAFTNQIVGVRMWQLLTRLRKSSAFEIELRVPMIWLKLFWRFACLLRQLSSFQWCYGVVHHSDMTVKPQQRFSVTISSAGWSTDCLSSSIDWKIQNGQYFVQFIQVVIGFQTAEQIFRNRAYMYRFQITWWTKIEFVVNSILHTCLTISTLS